MSILLPLWRRSGTAVIAAASAAIFTAGAAVAHAYPQSAPPSSGPRIIAPVRITLTPAQLRAIAEMEKRGLRQPMRRTLYDRYRGLKEDAEATIDREKAVRRWRSPQAKAAWETQRREELRAPAVVALCREYRRYRLTPDDLDVIDAEGIRERWNRRPRTIMRSSPTDSDTTPRIGFPFGGGKAPTPSPDPLP